MNGLATAASIIVCNSAAAALVVYATACRCPWGMNLCWIAALAILYAPAVMVARRPA